MNIVDALVNHHNVLRSLYQQSETDPAVFETYIRHLVVHHTMEEKYFYDFLEKVGSARHEALEAVNEHHIIELIIKDAEGFPQDHENFPIKIEGLGEYTNHHLGEEEEEIFPLARQLFSDTDMITLGKLFEQSKENMLNVELPEPPKHIDTSGTAAAKSTAAGLGIGSLKS